MSQTFVIHHLHSVSAILLIQTEEQLYNRINSERTCCNSNIGSMQQSLGFSQTNTIQAYIFFCSAEAVTKFPVNIACKVKTSILNEATRNLTQVWCDGQRGKVNI